jgi:hypothetical protein
MKSTLLTTTLAGAGLLFFGFIGAQAAPQNGDQDSWHENRDSYYRGESWRTRFFERVRQDLDHVQSVAFSGADEDRVVETEHQLDDLQNKMAEGRYDQPELDKTIDSLGRVIADNRLSRRERDMLTDDLNRMRDYREHHENWR